MRPNKVRVFARSASDDAISLIRIPSIYSVPVGE